MAEDSVLREPDELLEAVVTMARVLGVELDDADLPAVLSHQRLMLRFAEVVDDGQGDEPAPVFRA